MKGRRRAAANDLVDVSEITRDYDARAALQTRSRLTKAKCMSLKALEMQSAFGARCTVARVPRSKNPVAD